MYQACGVLPCRPMVDPTELRKALDASTTFKFREMGVPAELLRAVYTCFRDDTTVRQLHYRLSCASYSSSSSVQVSSEHASLLKRPHVPLLSLSNVQANEVQPEARQVKGTYGGIIDSVFGLRVSEKADCRKCRRQIPLVTTSCSWSTSEAPRHVELHDAPAMLSLCTALIFSGVC